MAIIFVHDCIDRPLDILDREILYKEHWCPKEVVDSLVIHTPEDIVRSGYYKGELTTIIEENRNINIVILWIYVSPIKQVINALDSHNCFLPYLLFLALIPLTVGQIVLNGAGSFAAGAHG
jgi:hypothetical protein